MSHRLTKILLIFTLLLEYCYNQPEYHTLEANQMIIADENGYVDHLNALLTSVKFYMYLPDNKTKEITTDNARHLVDTSKPTKMIIHGPGPIHSQLWIDEMVTHYHAKGDFNIITVDWSVISTLTEFYTVSAVNSVGEVVANLIIAVSSVDYTFLDSVHLIGSNLGAQVGGAAGERVASTGAGKIDRITALDPGDEIQLLDKDDATFVDVIHTTYNEDVFGTVDFFVVANADVTQENHRYEIRNDEPTAEDIFTQSITDDDKFQAVLCQNVTAYVDHLCENDTMVFVGEWVPRNITGIYYLSTDGAFSNVLQKNYYILVFLCVMATFFRGILY